MTHTRTGVGELETPDNPPHLRSDAVPTLHVAMKPMQSHSMLVVLEKFLFLDRNIIFKFLSCAGRGGVSNQPWLGSWNDNVTVSLQTCAHTHNRGTVESNTSSTSTTNTSSVEEKRSVSYNLIAHNHHTRGWRTQWLSKV